MNQLDNNIDLKNDTNKQDIETNQMYNDDKLTQNNKHKKDRKKILLIFLLAMFLTGIAIGFTYALLSVDMTGTQTNVVQNGYVKINFSNVTSIDLTNMLPTLDNDVIEISTGSEGVNTMLFDIVTVSNGKMVLNYDLGISSITSGTTLTDSYIKFKLQKSTDGGNNWTYVLGNATSGVTINSRSTISGTYNLLNNYAIDSGQITTPNTIKYKLTAWIDSNWLLPNAEVTATCSDPTKTTGEDCYAAGEIWTESQQTNSETFKFSVTVSATQYIAP